MRELSDAKRLDHADVYKAGTHAAQLIRLRDRTEFRYLPGYGGPPVATTLPVSHTPVLAQAGAVPPFFTGLLPEGRRLTALRNAVKTSADDEFSLLLAVGEDAVGDVQVVPAGESPPAAYQPTTPVHWDRVSLREIFARSVGSLPDRVAIAGVQDKISGAMITLTGVGEVGPVVVKLDPPEFPHLVANEAFFLAAARDVKLPTATFAVVEDREGTPGLVLARFDRIERPGWLEACAQEDGCQVLGRYPADRYSVAAEEVVAALSAVAGAPAVARLRLFAYLVFGYLIGNGDLHAKNLSVTQRGGEWAVAPIYDTPASYPYGDTTLGMPLLGESAISDVPRRRWLDLAEAVGLPARAAIQVLDDLVAASPRWVDRLGELPFDDRTIAKFRRFLQYRIGLVGGR